MKGVVNSLPSDCHLDIDCHVSTANCRCFSGDGVDLLSRTICTTMNLTYYYAVKTL